MNDVTTPEVEAYLAAVRRELEDLPVQEREDLLEDLELHLADVANDPDRRDEPLHLVLGPPDTYAAELRAAAGLPPARAMARDDNESLWVTLGRRVARSRLGNLVSAAWNHPAAASAVAFGADLRPAWWVLRGFLVVALPAWWSIDGNDDFPIPSVLRSQVIGAVAVAAAIVLSVRVGRGETRLPLVKPALLNGAIVVAALALVPQAEQRFARPLYVSNTYVETSAELRSPAGPVTNIYPYAADGTPLEGVLLFDQDGRPLRSSHQEWWPDGCARAADHPLAADGVPVEFAYPKRYELASPIGQQRYSGPHGMASACDEVIRRPPVPLPTFPAAPAAAPQ